MIRLGASVNVCTLVVLMVVLNTAMALSQVVTGSILGRVTDTTGAVVPGATIQIQNSDTGFSQSVTADAEGRYTARNLPLGNYSITVQQPGFQAHVRRGIVLTVGSEATVNVELAVGNVSESVEVTAEAPAIETTTSALSGLVDKEQIRDLPLNGRSLDALALLSPGVFANRNIKPSASTGMGMRISINGGRPSDNLYLLDGTVVNDHGGRGLGGATTARLGVEGTLEFRVLTHNFSAEYGRNSGGVISAVTRSGSNDFHGSLYEFVRNNIFDARNFFNPGDLPPFRRNQFGAAAGGPLKKDRIFFFANYEALRERQGLSTPISVPDMNARRGLIPTAGGSCPSGTTNSSEVGLCQVAVNPAAMRYVNLYPAPNSARNFGDGTAENVADFSTKSTEDYFMGRMDVRLSDKDSFYYRYVFNPSEVIQPVNTPQFSQTTFATNHYLVLSETHIFSGASLNEFRAAFNRTDPGQDSLPFVALDPSLSFIPGQPFGLIQYGAVGSSGNQLASLGVSRTSPQHFAQNVFQTSDNFSTVRGAHSLKFGADFQRIQINLFQGSHSRGTYQFSGLQQLMEGKPTRFDFLVLDPPSAQSRGWRQNMLGWFVQDDYRLRPNLTLNLGLRHEFTTAPNEVNGRSGNLRNITDVANVQGPPFVPAKLNFSPRIGLAWDPTGSGKTSVRAGGGIFFNQILGRLWYHASNQNADYLKGYLVRNPTFFPTAFASGASIGSIIPAGSLLPNWHMEYHQNTPTVIHYNFEIQRQLSGSWSARAGYVGSYGYNITRWTDQNTIVPRILADGRKSFSPLPAAQCVPGTPVNTIGCVVNPVFADMGVVVSDSTFNYNAMQLSLQKTMSNGLHLQVAYTYSKTLSDADDTGSLPTFSLPGTTQDDNNRAGDYSLSAYDQRHTLVLNGVYQLVPLDKMLTNRAAKAILGGWAINGVYTYNTGAPVNILSGYNSSLNGSRYIPDRPDLAPGASSNPIHGVTAGCQGINAGEKLGTPDRWFDPCAFVLPAGSSATVGFFGNLGRNTVTGPGLSSFDFTLVKNSRITETKSLELRAEFFNLFNHANFFFPNLNVFNASRLRSGAAGRITETTTANRQIQLGLKLIF